MPKCYNIGHKLRTRWVELGDRRTNMSHIPLCYKLDLNDHQYL